MKVAIGADHGGFELKEFLKDNFVYPDISWVDVGTYNTESCDYPLVADKLSEVILNKQADIGVLICGSGIGISIAANRHKGIRAALLYNNEVASLAKEHNNANILCIGARIVGEELAKDIVNNWLNATFLEARHLKRISMIE